MNYITKLISSGLTNKEVGYTLGQVSSTRYKRTGVCKHESGNVKCGFTTSLVGLDQCPKCSRALYWIKTVVDA